MLTDYLQQLRDGLDALARTGGQQTRGWTLYDFVLDHGVSFSAAPLSDDERRILDDAMARGLSLAGGSYAPKHCFSNSQAIVLSDWTYTLRYVEGYASGLIPFHHGWVVINDKVVDVTLRPQIFGITDREYRGAMFSQDEVHAFMVETGQLGALIDDPHRDWPVMRAAYPDPREIS